MDVYGLIAFISLFAIIGAILIFYTVSLAIISFIEFCLKYIDARKGKEN